MRINGREHEVCPRTGFIKQVDAKPFRYDEAYTNRQSTTHAMAYLRLGVMMAVIGYETLKQSRTLEIGPGSGMLMDVIRPHVASIDGYDVGPSRWSTLNHTQATSRPFDLLVACDVIEHMPDIEALFSYNFTHAYISLPCPPDDITVFGTWRHFKPDEHLWYLPAHAFIKWVGCHGYAVIYHGSPEDAIRHRWNSTLPNVSTCILQRK